MTGIPADDETKRRRAHRLPCSGSLVYHSKRERRLGCSQAAFSVLRPTGPRGRPPGTPRRAVELLDRDRSAGALKGSLRLLRGLLVDLLKDGLRRAVDQVL